jgi:uncharacterized protein involved in exopolysaccharide biosynthesis
MDDIRSGNGNGYNNGSEGLKSLSSKMRDLVAVGFRRRVLLRRAFLISLLGALIAVMLFGIQYQSEVEVMVKRDARVDPAVTPDASPRADASGDSNVTTMDLNTEMEFMLHWDILAEVVNKCPVLWEGHPHPWTPITKAIKNRIPGLNDSEQGAAVVKLSKALTLTPVPSSGILQVQYSAGDPNDSFCVTQNLTRLYLQRHMQVNRPPSKVLEFFTAQTDMYHKKLDAAEAALLEYNRKHDVASAGLQKELAIQNEAQFLASLRTTEASIAQTKEKLQQMESAEKTTNPRVSTTQTLSDNATLMANLKTSLNTLQLSRTDLLAKYAPNYRTVQEVEQQIAETKAAIETQEKTKLNSDTTDRNPVYAWADSELAKAKTDLPTLEAQRQANSQNVATYNREAHRYNEGEINEANLTREVKAEEQNYLLYLGKREQARISEMLDQQRVLNVILAEPPTLPPYPTYSPLLLILVSFILAGLVGVGAALTADYLDSSFRTPDEVKEILRIPVFASIPVSEPSKGNGHEVKSGSVPKNGN